MTRLLLLAIAAPLCIATAQQPPLERAEYQVKLLCFGLSSRTRIEARVENVLSNAQVRFIAGIFN